jgi:hypothetical protein
MQLPWERLRRQGRTKPDTYFNKTSSNSKTQVAAVNIDFQGEADLGVGRVDLRMGPFVWVRSPLTFLDGLPKG